MAPSLLEVIALLAPPKVLAAPMPLEVLQRRCADVAAGVGHGTGATGGSRGAGAAGGSCGTAAAVGLLAVETVA